jgi:PleD family two-component response regulator
MKDPRTDEAIDALLAGRARHRGRPKAEPVPLGAGVPFGALESRVAWTQALARESARQQRYGRAASVVIFQVETLTKGAHADGWLERVAGPIAHAIRRGARETDLATRSAPGRFQVLLPETTESEAATFADRVVADCQVWLEAMSAPLGIRATAASTTGDSDLENALERALLLLTPRR